MITLRASSARGFCNQGWIQSRYVFSFHTFIDPFYMGYRNLRALNEHFLLPGKGSALHPHRHVEILTLVLHGELLLVPMTGQPTTLRPGQLHLLNSASGILHKELNPDVTKPPAHYLEIWLGTTPSSDAPSEALLDLHARAAEHEGDFVLAASPDGKDGSLKLHQKSFVWYASVPSGRTVHYKLEADRYGWIHMISGALRLSEYLLEAGDGGAITAQDDIALTAEQNSTFFLFDLS